MADEDKEFKIRIVTTADTTGVSNAQKSLSGLEETITLNSKQTKEFIDDSKKLSDAEDGVATAGNKSYETHRALKDALLQLNQFVPGLGNAAFMLAEGYKADAAAADVATAANDDLLVSLGGIAVVLLSIQVAIQYWERYKDAIKEAAEENSKQMQQIQDDTTKAFKAFQDFQNALNGGNESASKKYSDELQNRRAVLEARQRGEVEETKAEEQAELDQANTPLQKEEIKRKYEGALQRLQEAQAEEAKSVIVDVIDDIQADLQGRQSIVNDIQSQMPAAFQAMKSGADPGTYPGLVKEVQEQTKATQQLTDLLTSLKSEAQTKGDVAGVDAQTAAALAAIRNKSDFETGTRALLGDYGPKISASQEAAALEVKQAFENVHGVIDIFLNHAKEMNRDSAQFKNYVQNELDALQKQNAATATTGFR